MKRIIFCLLTASAVFAVAMSNADAATRKHHPKGYHAGKTQTAKPHYQQYVRRSVDGVLIDSEGWRYWKSWDNTCFRTLDYLSSESACSGGVGGF